jgi:hypothetical protein
LTAKKDGFPLAGWADIGSRENAYAPVLIMTERLLKQRLFYDENFLNISETEDTKRIIFIIDYMNGCTVESDLSLALFARQLQQISEFRMKIKLIILLKTPNESLNHLWAKLQISSDSAQIKLKETGGKMRSFNQTYKPTILFQDKSYFEFLLQKSTTAKGLLELTKNYPNLIDESKISKNIEQAKHLGEFFK